MGKRFRRTESAAINGIHEPRHSGWTAPHNCDDIYTLAERYQRNKNTLSLAQQEAVERRFPHLIQVIAGVLWLIVPLSAMLYIVSVA